VVVCSRKSLGQRSLVFTGLTLVCLIVLIVASAWISQAVFDLAGDGLSYQQRGIDQLAQGRNLIYGYDEDLDFRVINFPKGPWLLAAALYQITGLWEASKLFNWLLVFASAGCVLTTLLSVTRVPVIAAVVVSLVAAGNPISVMEATTFLVDGQLASLLLCGVALTVLGYQTRAASALLSLACVVMLAINVKLGAVGFVSVLGLGTILSCWILNPRQMKNAFLVGFVYIGSGLAGLTGFGYNPFVTNYLNHNNIFYPYGETIVIDGQTVTFTAGAEWGISNNWVGMNRFQKLFHSVYSATEVSAPITKLKSPFLITKRELEQLEWTTFRVGGFGPLFGAALLLALPVLVLALGNRKSRLAWAGMCFLVFLFASVTMNPVAWYARYSPQFWLFPVAVALLAFGLSPKWLSRILAAGVLLALLVNMAVCFCVQGQTVLRGSETLRSQLAAMKSYPQPVTICLPPQEENQLWFGCQNWFKTNEIQTRLIREAEFNRLDGNSFPLYRSFIRVHVPPGWEK
jgi:hypothetical protein